MLKTSPTLPAPLGRFFDLCFLLVAGFCRQLDGLGRCRGPQIHPDYRLCFYCALHVVKSVLKDPLFHHGATILTRINGIVKWNIALNLLALCSEIRTNRGGGLTECICAHLSVPKVNEKW